MSVTPARSVIRPATLRLFTAILLDLVAFGIVLPLLPSAGARFGAQAAIVGALVATDSLLSFLLAPAWGRLSDRIGRRPVILLGLAASVGSYLLFGLATSLATLFVSRIVSGCLGTTVTVTQAALADITPAERRSQAMGLVGAAFGIGFTIGPAIGGIASTFGESAPGLIAAGIAAVNLLLAAVILPETRGAAAPVMLSPGVILRPAVILSPAVSLDPAVILSAAKDPLPGAEILRSAQDDGGAQDDGRAQDDGGAQDDGEVQDDARAGRSSRPYLAAVFLTTLAFTVMYAVFPLYCQQHLGWDRARVSAGFVLVGLVTVLVQGRLVGRLAPQFGERTLVAAGAVLMAVGIALVPSAAALAAPNTAVQLAVFTLALAALGGGFSLAEPCLRALVSRATDPATQGRSFGAVTSAGAVARIAGPPLLGLIAQEASVVAAFMGAAVAAVLAVPFVRRGGALVVASR